MALPIDQSPHIERRVRHEAQWIAGLPTIRQVRAAAAIDLS
jgi:hypothetical protein